MFLSSMIIRYVPKQYDYLIVFLKPYDYPKQYDYSIMFLNNMII